MRNSGSFAYDPGSPDFSASPLSQGRTSNVAHTSLEERGQSLIPFTGLHRPRGLATQSRELIRDVGTARHHDQGRILLVSLLENFCMLYDQNPRRSRQLFFIICKTLYSMGIIEADYIDEMAAVRSSYMHAFRELLTQAMRSIDEEHTIETSQFMHRLSSSFEQAQQHCSPPVQPEIHRARPTDADLVVFDCLDLAKPRPQPRQAAVQRFWDNLSSRYFSDFLELEKLGKGGFGSVYRVKNRLDNKEYAIKKVVLVGKDNPLHKMLREITSLAQLEHPHIVRYYSSWLEVSDASAQSSSQESSDAECPSTGPFAIEVSEENFTDCTNSPVTEHPSHRSYGDDIVFNSVDIASLDDTRYRSTPLDASVASIDFLRPSGADSTRASNTERPSPSSHAFSIRSATSGEVGSLDSRFSRLSISPQPQRQELPFRPLTLHIQMQLCATNLGEYLVHRNRYIAEHCAGQDARAFLTHIDGAGNLRLFKRLVEGVAYFHTQGLIHRDLKPSNIFLDYADCCPLPSAGNDGDNHLSAPLAPPGDYIPRIGDFGLVTQSEVTILPDVSQSQSIPSTSQPLTSGVGTVTYASPEQLAQSSQAYDTKADIYSLGIIFFELFYPFATGMERVQVLQELKQSIIPADFLALFPKEAAFVLWLMAAEPQHRPTAQQILAFQLFDTADIATEQWQQEKRRLEHERRMMQAEISQLRLRVAQLEQQLESATK
ncbi:hypothetical protein H4R35_001173 [Dimargaris xerosporica]|nr:hypothetical protein H4R35_001173 [Dimargaris xerosporica]